MIKKSFYAKEAQRIIKKIYDNHNDDKFYEITRKIMTDDERILIRFDQNKALRKISASRFLKIYEELFCWELEYERGVPL